MRQQMADAWCAAFVMEKAGGCSPSKRLRPMPSDDLERRSRCLVRAQKSKSNALLGQYQFFHWHLAFPEVFAKGGFDCVLGNPPWERVKLQEKEWFAERSPEIANAPNAAARKRLIEALKSSDPALYQQFLDDSAQGRGRKPLPAPQRPLSPLRPGRHQRLYRLRRGHAQPAQRPGPRRLRSSHRHRHRRHHQVLLPGCGGERSRLRASTTSRTRAFLPGCSQQHEVLPLHRRPRPAPDQPRAPSSSSSPTPSKTCATPSAASPSPPRTSRS